MLDIECLYNERGIFRMKYYLRNGANTDKVKNTSDINKTESTKNVSKNIGQEIKEIFSKPLSITIIASLVSMIIGSIATSMVKNHDMGRDVDEINDSLASIKTSTIGLPNEVNNLNSQYIRLDGKMEDLRVNLAIIETKTGVYTDLMKLNQHGIDTLVSKNDAKNYPVMSSLVNSDIIATNENGEEFKAGQLINKRIFLTYTDDGSEVYFIGTYNENFHWNEKCLVHSYKDDLLAGIMESVYDNGNLLSYKQVIPYETSSEGKVWYASEKTSMDGVNFGDTYIYEREDDYYKDFTMSNAVVEEILTYEEFVASIDTPLVGFYHGNTSEGWFNDDTGNAYIIKYMDGAYQYYKGVFEGGEIGNPAIYKPITIEELDKLIDVSEFACELRWHIN